MSFTGLTPSFIKSLIANMELDTDVHYFGDKDTDGSWRVIRDSGTLKIQERVAGVWTLRLDASAGSGGATTLDGLNDVSTTGVANGDVLTYSTSGWSPVSTLVHPELLVSSWYRRNITNQGTNSWQGITYGNGLFVAVGWSLAATSPDGITWTSRTPAALNQWNAVTFGNGVFVAVAGSGTNNRVMTSTDGITWTIRTSPSDQSWQWIEYNNGLFVATSGASVANNIMTSPDGITWTLRNKTLTDALQDLTFGNGLWVACSVNARMFYSSDAITWSNVVTSIGVNTVAFGNGRFIAIGFNGVLTSTNGTTWSTGTAAQANVWKSIIYANGLFVAVSNSGTNRVACTFDGATWRLLTASSGDSWNHICFAKGLFVAVAPVGSHYCMSTSIPAIV